MAGDDDHRTVSVNWRTINIPSMVAMATLLITVLNIYSNNLTRLEKIEAALLALGTRIDVVDRQHDNAMADVIKQMDYMIGQQTLIGQLAQKNEYRIISLENRATVDEARTDKLMDMVSNLREGITQIKASIEVLTEKIDAMPGNSGSTIPPNIPSKR